MHFFGVGRTQELAPSRYRLMLLEDHDCNRPAGHEGHQTIIKRFSLVLLIKLGSFIGGQGDDALPEYGEAW